MGAQKVSPTPLPAVPRPLRTSPPVPNLAAPWLGQERCLSHTEDHADTCFCDEAWSHIDVCKAMLLWRGGGEILMWGPCAVIWGHSDISRVLASTEGHVRIRSPAVARVLCWCHIPPNATWMSMVCAVTWSQMDFHWLCSTSVLLPWARLMWAACTTILRPEWCLRSSVPLRALSGSLVLLQMDYRVHAVVRNHLEARDQCSHWLKSEEATFAVILMSADTHLSGKNFCGNSRLQFPHPTEVTA